MNKVPTLFAVLLALVLVQSCDFFRHMAGRPDSEWINAKRARLELAEHRRDSIECARRDSVRLAQQAEADSLHAVDSLLKVGKLRKASDVKSISKAWLDERWALVVGVFANDTNARKLASKYEAAGYRARISRTRSGMNILVVAPCGTISDAMKAYREVKRLPFASKETWVIVKE